MNICNLVRCKYMTLLLILPPTLTIYFFLQSQQFVQTTTPPSSNIPNKGELTHHPKTIIFIPLHDKVNWFAF